MSFVDRLLLGQPRDVSEIEVPLEIDLESLTFAGLGRGARQESIEHRLGPPSSFGLRRRGRLEYPRLGVYFALESKRLRGYDVMVRVYDPGKPSRDARRPFAGLWSPGCRRRPPSLEELKERYGEPAVREPDYELTEYTWNRPDWLIAAEFDESGALWAFMVDFG